MNALTPEQREIVARLQSGRLMICDGQGDPNSDGCGGQGYTGAAGQESCPHCYGAGVMTPELRAALASAPSPEAGAGGDLVSYLHRQWAWSKETFGPALRTKGIVQHITKELREIEAEPHDLAEWVDVIILAMDGFWRHGGKPEDLLPAMQAKQDKNFARQWPDWRTMGEDQAIEHDRSGEAASCDRSPKGEDAEGGFVHEGAVAEGQTPEATPKSSPDQTPVDPQMTVEEASEVLDRVSAISSPSQHAKRLRDVASKVNGTRARSLLARASRIEAALRTLQAAGEVRHDQ